MAVSTSRYFLRNSETGAACVLTSVDGRLALPIANGSVPLSFANFPQSSDRDSVKCYYISGKINLNIRQNYSKREF